MRGLSSVLLLVVLAAVGANFWFDYQRGGFDPDKGRDFLTGVSESIILHDKIDAAKDSVFLVVGTHKDITGEFAVGTSFLMDDTCAVFATNAHVADVIEDEDIKLAVKHPEDGKSWPVQSVKVHPARDLFLKIVDEYGPIIKVGKGGYRPVRAFWGYDAALLYAHDGPCADAPLEGLPKPLKIAPWEELSTLSGGDPIALIGYHGSGTTTRGLEQYTVTARVDMGNIRAVGSYIPFIADGKARNQRLEQLVQHILPTTPGTSGSPIIGASGNVIAINAGATDTDDENDLLNRERIAHRADIIAELLNGDEARLINDYRVSITEYLGQYMPAAAVIAEMNAEAIAGAATESRRGAKIGDPKLLKGEFSPVQDGFVIAKRPNNASEFAFNAKGRYYYLQLPLENASAHLLRAVDFDIDFKADPRTRNPDYLCPIQLAFRPQGQAQFQVTQGGGVAPTFFTEAVGPSGETTYEFVVYRPDGCSAKALTFDIAVTPFVWEDKPADQPLAFLQRFLDDATSAFGDVFKTLNGTDRV